MAAQVHQQRYARRLVDKPGRCIIWVGPLGWGFPNVYRGVSQWH